MSTVKKNRLSLLAISVLTATSLLGVVTQASAAIDGTPATKFTASVTVVSNSSCTLTVSPPANPNFATTFTADVTAVPATSQIVVDSDPAPRYIMVQANGGATCGINGIVTKITTNNPFAALYANSLPNSVGGVWQFRPEIVDYRVYAATTTDTTAPSDTKVCVVNCYGNDVSSAAGSMESVSVGGASPSLTMADRYQTTDQDVIPINTPFTAGLEDWESTYKTAAIGIGGYLATKPMNASGAPDLTAASDGDVSNIAFTVTISQA